MKIFSIFFWKAIKIAGWAQKERVGRVSGNTGIFLGLNTNKCLYYESHENVL